MCCWIAFYGLLQAIARTAERGMFVSTSLLRGAAVEQGRELFNEATHLPQTPLFGEEDFEMRYKDLYNANLDPFERIAAQQRHKKKTKIYALQ